MWPGAVGSSTPLRPSNARSPSSGAVNVAFQNARPKGAALNRHGMPQLPVGQHVVKNWPVLDLGEQPAIATDA